jgi:hypothetical protein
MFCTFSSLVIVNSVFLFVIYAVYFNPYYCSCLYFVLHNFVTKVYASDHNEVVHHNQYYFLNQFHIHAITNWWWIQEMRMCMNVRCPRARRGGITRGVISITLHLGTRCSSVGSFRHRPLYSQTKIHTEQKAGWTPHLIWTFSGENLLPPPENRTPDCPLKSISARVTTSYTKPWTGQEKLTYLHSTSYYRKYLRNVLFHFLSYSLCCKLHDNLNYFHRKISDLRLRSRRSYEQWKQTRCPD